MHAFWEAPTPHPPLPSKQQPECEAVRPCDCATLLPLLLKGWRGCQSSGMWTTSKSKPICCSPFMVAVRFPPLARCSLVTKWDVIACCTLSFTFILRCSRAHTCKIWHSCLAHLVSMSLKQGAGKMPGRSCWRLHQKLSEETAATWSTSLVV